MIVIPIRPTSISLLLLLLIDFFGRNFNLSFLLAKRLWEFRFNPDGKEDSRFRSWNHQSARETCKFRVTKDKLYSIIASTSILFRIRHLLVHLFAARTPQAKEYFQRDTVSSEAAYPSMKRVSYIYEATYPSPTRVRFPRDSARNNSH